MGFSDVGYTHKRRAGNLAAWHGMLAEHLAGTDDSGLLDRLVSHRAHHFAAEIGADLPPRARQVADERSRAQALIGPAAQQN